MARRKLFKCWWEGAGESIDDAIVLESFDAGSAAEMFAERRDRFDSEYPDRFSDVMVCDAADETTRWSVWVNTRRTYTAMTPAPAEDGPSAERSSEAG